MTPLIEVAMMNFEQLSTFVQKATNGEKYIAKPGEASEIDCDVCSEAIINTVVMPAIREDHKRVDSRSLKVGESDAKTAELIASAALTYWVNHGFIISTNARISRAISAQIIEQEKAQAKADLLNLQIDHFGAILQAKKTHFKQGLQACWDFDESELVAKQMGDEGTAGKLDTLEFDTNYHKAIAC